MLLCNSSILPGAPLRPCWNVWQAKAFITILMQINCITHNLVFHSPLFPQGHNHSLWGLTSLLSPCTMQLLLPCNPQHHKGWGAEKGSGQGTQLSTWAAQQAEESDVQHQDCNLWCNQPGTSHFFTYDPTSMNNMHHPSCQCQHCWKPFPPAFRMRRAFVEELKKTPSNQSWSHWQVSTRKSKSHLLVPHPFSRECCPLPAVSPGWALWCSPRALGQGRQEWEEQAPGWQEVWQILGRAQNQEQFKKQHQAFDSPCKSLLGVPVLLFEGRRRSWGELWERPVQQKNMGQTPKHHIDPDIIWQFGTPWLPFQLRNFIWLLI